ncbi:MAG: indole-3-glycerol-phosphate synthase [Nitrospinae bacterium]|nr:indole-3-glycerol-phosphate synthase [Nitrospinota bacterium]
MSISPVLQAILDHKTEETRHARKLVSEADLIRVAERRRGDFRSLHGALANKGDKPGIIAEIKRASPSTMFKASDFHPARIAAGYEKAGASALSVITESRFFCGSPMYIPILRPAVSIPVLRKDFILDRWQVAETAALGADAILLMTVNFEDTERFADLYRFAVELGLEPLVEIHSSQEWESVRGLKPRLVGVNNRDFRSPTLSVDMMTTGRIAPLIAGEAIVVSESGISSPEDMIRISAEGADGFLIGSGLMREDDPGAGLERLIGQWRKLRTR